MRKVLLILSLSMTCFFRWPAENGRITSSFAEYRPDHFHDGIDMISSVNNVYPIDEGELLYMWNKELFPFDNYSGSGNYKIVSHGEYASEYLHLDDSSDAENNISSSKPIAKYANTGRSFGNHIHFGIISLKDWSSINPFVLAEKVPDSKAPVISEIAFNIDGKVMRVKDKTTVRLTKNHSLLIAVFDEINKGDKLGVFTLEVSHNGKTVTSVKFDKLTLNEKKITLAGKPYDDVYNSSYYVVSGIKWTAGDNIFSVKAADFSGNTSVKDFTLVVNKEF